jgi:hypothetical protein
MDEYGSAYGSPGKEGEFSCPAFGSTAEGSSELGNPNDIGLPDDIPARSGEPVKDPAEGQLPSEHDNDPIAGADGGDTTGDFGGDYGFFRDISENRLRRGVFTGVPELTNAIEQYAAHHNANPKPFI